MHKRNQTRLKIRWAKLIYRARSFVIMTDEKSVIWVDGLHPDMLFDKVILETQRAKLLAFRDNLDELIKNHDEVLNNLEGPGM